MINRQSLITFALGIAVGLGIVVGMYAVAQGATEPTKVQLDTSNCVSHLYSPGGNTVGLGLTRMLEDRIVTSIGTDFEGQWVFTTMVCD